MSGAVPASLPALAEALASGALDLFAYLGELESRFAAREGEIHAFVPEPGRFDRLRREAETLLQHLPDPAHRPPLFGVPVGVKDIFHVQGFATRAGSALPPDALAGQEAAAVSRLKAAGALILGKTVTTEFASFAPGPTRNPANVAHTPGGSSSGSAAAVAAGFAPLTVGSQTIGSVARPASFCGVVGTKPTYDRVSRAGVIPVSTFLDHVGWFTVDVAGAHLVASLLCHDWRGEVPHRPPVAGVPEGPYLERATAEGLDLFQAACEQLKAAGLEIKPVPLFADFDEIEARHRRLFDGEMARTHEAWFRRYENLYRPKTVEILMRGRRVRDEQLAADRAGRAAVRAELEAAMAQHEVDLWLSPSATGTAPLGIDATGDPIMNLPWTQAGVPTVTVPAGRGANDLPFGLQIAGRAGEDEALLAWARPIERELAG